MSTALNGEVASTQTNNGESDKLLSRSAKSLLLLSVLAELTGCVSQSTQPGSSATPANPEEAAATPEPATVPEANMESTQTPAPQNNPEVPTPPPEVIPTPNVVVLIGPIDGTRISQAYNPNTPGVTLFTTLDESPLPSHETGQYFLIEAGEGEGQYNFGTGELVLGTTISVPIVPTFGLKDGAGGLVVAFLKENLIAAISRVAGLISSAGLPVALSTALVTELAITPGGALESVQCGHLQQVVVEKGNIYVVDLTTGERVQITIGGADSTVGVTDGSVSGSSPDHTNCAFNWTEAQMRAIRDGFMKVYFITESEGVPIYHAYGIWNGKVIMPQGMYFSHPPSLTPQQIEAARMNGTASDITEAVQHELGKCDYHPLITGD